MIINRNISYSKMPSNVCIIRNPTSGLVLEPKDSTVQIQYYDGFAVQKWRVEVVTIPECLIIANNNEVLDVEGDGEVKSLAKVITSPRRGCDGDSKQHWIINSDHTIANASARDLVMDVKDGKFVGGNNIIVYPHGPGANQKFELVYPDA